MSRIETKDQSVLPVNFAALVAAARFSHEDAPAKTDLDALEEIETHLEWIKTNLEEGDPEAVRIHNLAQAVAAAYRYGDLLASKLTPQQIAKIREEMLAT